MEKTSIDKLQEYKQVKDDLRTWARVLVGTTAVWWALNAAFFGVLLYKRDVLDQWFWLKFWFGFLAVVVNATVNFHAWGLSRRYHKQTQWIRENMDGYVHIPPMRLTEWSYRLAGVILLFLWLWYWLPMFLKIVPALPDFPLG